MAIQVHSDPTEEATVHSASASASGQTISVSYNVTIGTILNGAHNGGYTWKCVQIKVDGVVVEEKGMTWHGDHGYSYNASGNYSGTFSSGNHTVTIQYHCSDVNSPSGCGSFESVLWSSTVTCADPYSAPGYDIWSATQIVRIEVNWVDVNYKINGGTNNLDWVVARVDGMKDYGLGTGKGDSLWGNFYPRWSEGFKHGSFYNVRIRFSDSHSEYETGHKTFYTYQEPTLTGVSANPTGVNAQNQNITFTQSGVNDRAWASYEEQFYTLAHCTVGSTDIGNGWTKVGSAGNSSTFTLNGATLRGFVPKAYDDQTITMQVKRRNNSANWDSLEKTCTFVVYYRPKKGVTCSNISLKKNGPSGGTITKGDLIINDASLTGIYVTWNFDITTADAGYTQGYRIRIYNTSGSVVKTYYTTSKSYTVPKADIPKMQDTYIDVTPYFANDQPSNANASYASNYWYYTSPSKCDFVVMAARLAKPQITYPVNNSEWINNRFRVCFQLPTDPDKGSELETYHYEDIELQINGNYTYRLTSSPQAMTTTGNCYQSAGVFSSLASNLTYQRKIVAAPCLGTNFPTSPTTYTIRVRVKKKYTTSKKNWSDWSDTVTIKIVPAVFNPSRGDTIYASHYNNAKKTIDRVRKTYRSCMEFTTIRCSSKTNKNIKNTISLYKLV